jgi:hypothetical protein
VPVKVKQFNENFFQTLIRAVSDMTLNDSEMIRDETTKPGQIRRYSLKGSLGHETKREKKSEKDEF